MPDLERPRSSETTEPDDTPLPATAGPGVPSSRRRPLSFNPSVLFGTEGFAVGAEFPPAPHGFLLRGQVGGGATGVVYRAEDVATGRIVAVKFIGAFVPQTARERFRDDTAALAGVDHPNVVRVFASDIVGPHPHLTMEFAPGGTLARRVGRGGPLDLFAAVRLLEAAARGVAAAHALGVVHQDIKPSHILFADTGTPKVADFGSTRRTGAGATLTGPATVPRTPHYMAPELAAGGVDIGPQADVYSLGATLFEALTGRPPFVGQASPILMDRIRFEDPPTAHTVNPAVPAPLSAVVATCLRKNAADRYPSARELADDLARWRSGGRASAKPPSPLTRLGTAAASLWKRATPKAGPRHPTAESIRARLRAGEAVTLVDARGPNLPVELLQGGCEFVAPNAAGGFWLQARDSAMIRFLDGTGIDSYRVAVELCQHPLPGGPNRRRDGEPDAPRVGLLADYSCPANDALRAWHSAVVAWYGEADGRDPTLTLSALGAHQHPLDGTSVSACDRAAVPLPMTATISPWRTIEIEVSPRGTSLRSAGHALGDGGADDRAARHRAHCEVCKYHTPAAARPAAGRSIGVWARAAWLGVRTLTVTPLHELV